MTKKISSDWKVAFIFYFIGNVLANIPTFIFFRILPLFSGNTLVQLVIGLIASLGLFYLGFNLSGAYISKHYIITRRQGIIRWAVGYLVVINILLLLSKYSKDIFGMPSMVTLFGLVMFAVVLAVFVPKSLLISSQEEVDEAVLAKPPKPKKSPARTGMVFGYVFAELGLDAFVGGLLSLVVGKSHDNVIWARDLIFLFQSVIIVVFVVWLFRATFSSKRFAWMAGIISVTIQTILIIGAVLISGVNGLSLYITILYLPLYLLAPVFLSRFFNKSRTDNRNMIA